jgi:hypothetical protein
VSVQDIDKGYAAIMRELKRAQRREVAVGVLTGSVDAEGTSIAEYATYNEFGTGRIPSRPALGITFDESKAVITQDFHREVRAILDRGQTADGALTKIGLKHAQRIQSTITNRNILPALAPSTVKAKKGSTKTLVDTGAFANAIQIAVRGRSR